VEPQARRRDVLGRSADEHLAERTGDLAACSYIFPPPRSWGPHAKTERLQWQPDAYAETRFP
jgi:hypothetical protein